MFIIGTYDRAGHLVVTNQLIIKETQKLIISYLN